jgi:ABC-type branched-subunit amino acid transport system ATPase component
MSVIEVTDLRKSYAGRTVVDGVSFAVEEGEIFGVLGPNGAGKTTTVECVEGLRVPDPVAEHEATRHVLGAQLQESELQAKLTVREGLACTPPSIRARSTGSWADRAAACPPQPTTLSSSTARAGTVMAAPARCTTPGASPCSSRAVSTTTSYCSAHGDPGRT